MNLLRMIWGRKAFSHRLASAGLLLALMQPALAQDQAQDQTTEFDDMQKNIELFSGVLREALGLNQRAGLFNPLAGSVRGIYLAEQGIMLEMVTPLASSRSMLSIQSIGASLQSLSGRIPRPPDINALRESMALSMRADVAQDNYRTLMERIASTDFSTEVEDALRQASDSMRSLRDGGYLDQALFDSMLQGLNEERERFNARRQEMQALRNQVNTDTTPGQPIDDETVANWERALEDLVGRMGPIRDAALAKANEVKQMSEAAKAEHEQEWQRDLAKFETRLFGVICDYSAALRVLPDDQHLTIVLKGLGAENDQRREDRIHVLNKSDMQRCQMGEIDAEQLRSSAQTYSF